MVLKDSDILLNTFPSGSKATFVCTVGYTPGGGSGVVTCNAGTWSSPTLKCQSKLEIYTRICNERVTSLGLLIRSNLSQFFFFSLSREVLWIS